MQTQAIQSSSRVSSQEQTTRGFQDLNSEDFFALMIAELQSQDPLKPTDNQQLLNQMATIREMEQSSNLNKTLSALASEQRFGATAGLIGHYVFGTATDSGGNPVEIDGVVTGVKFDKSGNAILELHNGKLLPAGKVEIVTLLENLPDDILDRLGLQKGQIPGKTTSPSQSAARSTPATGQSKSTEDWSGGVAETLDHAAGVLNALVAPGVSVGV